MRFKHQQSNSELSKLGRVELKNSGVVSMEIESWDLWSRLFVNPRNRLNFDSQAITSSMRRVFTNRNFLVSGFLCKYLRLYISCPKKSVNFFYEFENWRLHFSVKFCSWSNENIKFELPQTGRKIHLQKCGNILRSLF